MSKKWKYSGDVNLTYGGFYWRKDKGADYAEIVRITPCADAGGPDNLFEISSGSVYLPEGKATADALACCGAEDFPPSDSRDVESQVAYSGIDSDSSQIVRIGPPSEFWADRGGAWNPAPDTILRSNVNLANYVRREFLRG